MGKKIITSITMVLLFTISAWAKVEYDAAQLLLKNAEQVTDLVRKKIQRATDIQAKLSDDETQTADPEAILELKDGMRIALSRPDQDGLRSILFGRLRRELGDIGGTDKVLQDLANEGVGALKSKSTGPNVEATYIILLENLMAEIKPDVQTNSSYKQIIETIRDAKIEIPKDMMNKEFLTLMKSPVSPSKTAADILPKNSKNKSGK